MSYNVVDQSTGDLEQIAGSQVNTIYADAPLGAIVAFGGDTAPTGWLICDGSAISRTTYAALFAAIGTKYGAGDGSTTFNLPAAESGAALYPVGNADGLANSKYIIKAVKSALPTEFEDELAAKNDLKLCSDATKEIRFGTDSNGDYGYYKDGADTVTPFSKGYKYHAVSLLAENTSFTPSEPMHNTKLFLGYCNEVGANNVINNNYCVVTKNQTETLRVGSLTNDIICFGMIDLGDLITADAFNIYLYYAHTWKGIAVFVYE